MIEKLLKHPWVVIIVIAAITLFFALQLPKAQLDNNNLRFVPSTDPARIISAKIDDTFGSSLFVLVGLERKYGTVFDRDFLFRIREFEDRVKTLNIVGDVNSIMSTEYIWGSGGSVIVEDLVSETFSGSPEEIAALRQRLLSWNMYDRSLLSDDFRATQIYVPLEIPSEDAGKPEVVGRYTEIRKIAEEMFSGMASVYVTGLPAFSGAINDAMFADLRLLVPLVILVVIFIVFLPMRRISFVLLSLLSVLIAVIWSIGAMPLFGIKLTILSTVLPVILIAVGNSYSLHVVIHYIEGSGRDLGSMTYREHRDFVQGMIGVITVPVFLAALTTLVSFLAFCVTMVLPIREFGFFATFGVAASYVIAMTLTPSILILRGPKPLRGKRKEGQSLAAYKIADYLTRIVRHKYRVLAVTLAVFLVSLYGATKVVIDNIMVEYFRRDSDIVRSDEFIRTRFGGSKVISVVAEADSPELLLHPDTLSALDRLGAYLASDVPEVGKVMGFTDLIKRINQVFNAGEDPSGLKPAPETTDAADAGDFGFGGDGFGFEESGAGGDDFG
ncbi:MAG: MMPL family transporter, partial [Spirochaetaceae bacterium]|nr:MMPL family transporter [Spirochaetaceae bacterium]